MGPLFPLNIPKPFPDLFSVHSQTALLSEPSHRRAWEFWFLHTLTHTWPGFSLMCLFYIFFTSLWEGEKCTPQTTSGRTEENLQVPVFAFYRVGSGDVTPAVRLGRMISSWLGLLSGPGKAFIILAFPVPYTDTSCDFNFHFPSDECDWTSFYVFFCKPYGFLCKQYARFNAVIYPIINFWQFIFLCIQIPSPLLHIWHVNVFSLIFSILSLVSCQKHRFLNFGCSPICYWLSFYRNSVKSLCNSKFLDVMQCPSSWLQQRFDFHNFAMALTVLEPEHGVPSSLVKPSPPELPLQPNMEKLLK